MSRKEFVLDVIVNKLNLKDETIKDTNNLLAKFTFGDIKLDITTGRVNVADFGEGRSVEFTSTLDALKRKLQTIPLELTLINPAVDENKYQDPKKSASVLDKKSSGGEEKSVETDKKDDNDEEKLDQKENDDQPMPVSTLPANVVGIVSLKWPPALIDRLTDHCTAVVPHIQVCDIQRDEENVGNITLGIMLHCKCEEKPSISRNKLPYINEQGILTAFQEARKEMEKNDVFFVIGRNPEPCEQLDDNVYQEVSPCAGRQRYPLHLDTSRYKLIRGTLVKDCSKLQTEVCGEQDCCVNWYDPQKEPTKLCPQPKKKKNVCTCQEIFGSPSGDVSTRRSGKEIRASLMSERRRSSMSRRASMNMSRRGSMSMSRRGSMKQTKQDASPKDEIFLREELQQILAERLEQYRREEEEFSRPTDTKNLLPPRFCPKCCENMTMYPKRAPCPKCGFKLSAKRVYSQNETADDILNQWDPDEKAFFENNGFSKFDHCTCHERGDRKFKRKCLYCRIRDIRNEVNDYGPPEESLIGPPKERILSDSDVSCQNDDDVCEKILREYGDDDEKLRSKLWQDGEGPPRLSVIMDMFKRVLPPTQTGLESGSKVSEKTQKSQLRKAMQLKRKNMSVNEKIMGRRNVRGTTETPQPPPPKNLKQFIREMKRKYGRRYCFPRRVQPKEILIRHDECVPESYPVPQNMGWLWSLDERAVKRGWRPGKISRPIRELMAYFLNEFPVDSLPTTQELAKLVRPPPEPESESEEELVQKPTLRIQKRDGQYLITMHPLKTEKELQHSADPYAKADPIQFKIAKNPLDMKRRQIKRYLKDIGFRKCTCKQPAVKCDCRTYMEKERLDNSLKYICDMVQATSLKDAVCLSDTTESESNLNIEFTPPAGVIKPHLSTKPDIAENSTQYDANDYGSQFVKRTEEVIRQEIKKKKRHSCAGPIQPAPCFPKQGGDKRKKKGRKGPTDKEEKQAKSKEKVVSKDQVAAKSEKQPAANKGKGKK